MIFTRYSDMDAFANDTLEVLLENEIQNNLPISFIHSKAAVMSNCILATVKDTDGAVVLSASCTPPYNILIYETGNRQNNAAVKLLCDELKSINFEINGVMAEQGLAHRFATEYFGGNTLYKNVPMNVMRLDKINQIEKASGYCRPLQENDLYYVPYWERAFSEECNIVVNNIPTYYERAKSRIEKEVYYIWEDGHPVSQAVHGRSTPNGAVVNGVYTPPYYRGRGYASSVVAELSQILLDRGNKFCCLFADAENPISCGIYRKIGYYDICILSEIKFDNP